MEPTRHGNARLLLLGIGHPETRPRTLSSRIDLILTDTVLPGGVAGHALATRLRTGRASLPVIIACAYSEEIVEGRLLECASIACLAKPYDHHTLAGAVRLALG